MKLPFGRGKSSPSSSPMLLSSGEGNLHQHLHQHPSTGPPTYQIIKVPNANHMNVMKTSLTIIPMCPRERFPSYKSLSRRALCYKKDWAILLHLFYFFYLLPVTNYLITNLSVTDNFSACRELLVISFCSSLGSTLLLIERTTIDPLYLWVISEPLMIHQAGYAHVDEILS